MVVTEKKQAFVARVQDVLLNNKTFILSTVDNVGSTQMHEIRRALRGHAQLIMGKNTLIKIAIRNLLKEKPELELLTTQLKGNLGIVATNDDVADVIEILRENKKPAPAKAGQFAPNDVTVPAGNTGMEPTMTTFLQALNIPSKISRGTVEIISDVPLLKTGDLVGESEATLLQKLDIKPFAFGMEPTLVYDEGEFVDAKVYDMGDEQFEAIAMQAINRITALSLATKIPTLPAVPHMFMDAFKNLAAVSIETEFVFPQVEKLREMALNPEAFAAAAPAATEEKVEEQVVEESEEEESDEDMMGGLF